MPQKSTVSISDPAQSPTTDVSSNFQSSHRVAIQELKTLRPILSSVESVTSASTRDSAGLDAQSEGSNISLTAEEKELLERLEQQNRQLSANELFKAAGGSRKASVMSATADVNDPLLLNARRNQQQQSIDEEDWDFWGRLLQDFDTTVRKNGKQLLKKIQAGIPQALRGSVWTSLSRNNPASFLKHLIPTDGTDTTSNSNHFNPPEAIREMELDDAFIELIKVPSPHEKMIIRDLSRTFPKHEFFKNAEGAGQESLFNVMKAYSLYDAEVGYCQGLSFIAGVLLLSMPDEQAFACLVHLMHTVRSC